MACDFNQKKHPKILTKSRSRRKPKRKKSGRTWTWLLFFLLETHAIYSQDHVGNSSPFGFARREKNNLGRWSRFFFGAFYGHHVLVNLPPFFPPEQQANLCGVLEGNQKRAASQTPKVGGWFSKEPPLFFSGTKERLNVNA